MEKKLPKGWVNTKLLNLADVYTGKKNANYSTENGDYTFFTCAYEPLLSDGYSYEGDVLILPGNGANVGEVFNFFGKFEAYQRTYIVDDIKISSRYLYYYFKRYWKEEGTLEQYGSATNYIKIGNFENFNVMFPSLVKQERIVEKLDSLFSELEIIKDKMSRVPKLLKQFRQEVLTQAVTGKLTEDWREGKGFESWSEINLGSVIVSIKSGKSFRCPETPVKHGTVGLVKISAVTWGEFNHKETKTVIDENKINPNLFIKKGDFLISRANTLELVGSSVIVNNIDFDIMLSDKVWRVNFENDIQKRYVNLFFKSNEGRKEIEERATGNQLSMRNISQTSFRDIRVPWTNIYELQEIVKRVESLFKKADAIEEAYKSLEYQFDQLPQAILTKAFSGELVEQLPTDGDAKDLLKEILKLKEELSQKKKPVKKSKSVKKKLSSSDANLEVKYPLYSILTNIIDGCSEEKLFFLSKMPQHKFLLQLDIELDKKVIIYKNDNILIVNPKYNEN